MHYIPVYLHPYYRKLGFQPGYCKEAEKYYSEAISLPIYPGLSIKQQNEVASCISKSIVKVKIAIIPARGGVKGLKEKISKLFMESLSLLGLLKP